MTYETPPTNAPQALPNSSMALVSLITGILGLTFVPLLGSIIAVITGYMGRKEIAESGGALGGDGMATAGLVIGWIGIGLSVIGCCVAAVIILIPLLLVPLGIMSDGYGFILPQLAAFLL